jgi:hypothetical protein
LVTKKNYENFLLLFRETPNGSTKGKKIYFQYFLMVVVVVVVVMACKKKILL